MEVDVLEVMRGRAFATLNASAQGAAMFGYPVGGALVGHVPARLSVAALVLAGVLVVAVLMPSVLRAARREQRDATDAPKAMLATVPAIG